jgi:hypothetical protein
VTEIPLTQQMVDDMVSGNRFFQPGATYVCVEETKFPSGTLNALVDTYLPAGTKIELPSAL